MPNLFIMLLIATFAAYYPGTEGPYLLDDLPVLQNNPAFSPEILNQYGVAPAAYSFLNGFNRPLSMLSFALNYQQAGNIAPYSIKLTNILLHLLMGSLLYSLGRRLYTPLIVNWQGRVPDEGESRVVALLAVALWMLHPLHVSTVLYAVQRMALLSSLFISMGLLLYLEGRQQLIDGKKTGLLWLLASFGLAGTAAVMSKENGALIVFYALLIELGIFRFQIAETLPRYVRSIVVAIPVLPSVVLAGLILRYLFMPESFATRDFTAWERLLTESRVLIFYLSELFYPDIERMGLFWGGELPSRGLFQPIQTLFSVTVLVALLLLSLWGVWKRRFIPFAFAILWFLFGHAMESTVLPLELVFEHRNYFASFGLALWVAWLLFTVGRELCFSSLIYLGLLLMLPLLLFYFLVLRVGYWGTADNLYRYEMQRAPPSARLWESYGLHLERSGREDQAIAVYQRAAEMYAEDATFTLGQWVLLRRLTKPVPHSLTEQAARQLQKYKITRGNLYNLLRLMYGCGAGDEQELEKALISAVENEYWFAPGWRELGIFALSDNYRRHADTAMAQLWLERLPEDAPLEVIRKNVDELSSLLLIDRCSHEND